MYFVDLIKKKINKEKAIIFVDIDGVIADYEFGEPLNFENKRPIKTNIKVFSELSKISNIELHILSIGKFASNIKEKNNWLDINAPFFNKNNRHILIKENSSNLKSKNIKLNYIQDFIKDKKELIIVVDDDNEILKNLKENLKEEVLLFQDSSLVD